MVWPLMYFSEDSDPYITRRSVSGSMQAGTLVIIVGKADPGTATSASFWRIWQETYDANGVVTKKLFMNGSNRTNQIWDNIAASGTTWS